MIILLLPIIIVIIFTPISHNSFFDSAFVTAIPSTTKHSLSELIQQGSPYLGDPSSPITIIDFSDFQCHLCARFVKNTEPLINETYIQTGQVALVFKHLPN